MQQINLSIRHSLTLLELLSTPGGGGESSPQHTRFNSLPATTELCATMPKGTSTLAAQLVCCTVRACQSHSEAVHVP